MTKADLTSIPPDSVRKPSFLRTHYICFLFPALAMVLLYFGLSAWPFGNGSVLVLDLNAQYIYYFEQFRDILVHGDSLLYSFERALGGEFMGIFAYYLSSPFSLLVALLPKACITEAIALITLLKNGCCGLSFGYYLYKTRSLSPFSTAMFSMLYALSSFVIVMQHNIMWIDNVIVFPLMLLAVDALIKYGRYRLYVVLLVYSVFSNFYIGYMMCLFLLFWFFARYFMLLPAERNPRGERAHFVKSLLRMAAFSLLAILICSIILLPTYYSLSFGKFNFSEPKWEGKQMFEFLDLLTKAFFGSYDNVRPSGMPFLYCGTIALILAPLYFFDEKRPLRRKLGMLAVMLLLLVSFNYSLADILWHGMQRPNWLNARFAFMFVGLELIMTADVFEHLDRFRTKTILASAAAGCTLLLILAKFGYEHLDPFRVVWPGILFFVLLAAVLPSIIRDMRFSCSPRAWGFLSFILTVEAMANSALMMYSLDADVSFSSRTSYREMIDEYSTAVDTYQDPADDAFYRSEKLVHRKKNDNFALDIRGLSNSTSTLNARAIHLLQQLGYASMSHWSIYAGSTPVTDALLDIEYVIADETDDKPVPQYIHQLYEPHASTDDHLDVYHNPYALSIAYAVHEDLLSYDVPEENENGEEEEDVASEYTDPFTYMNELLSAMTGEKIRVWNRVDVDSSDLQGLETIFVTGHHGYEENGNGTPKLTWTLQPETDDLLFLYFPSEYPREADLEINGKEYGHYFKGEDFSIFEIGSYAPGEKVTIELFPQNEKTYIHSGCSYFWSFDEEAFRDAVNLLRPGTMDAHAVHDDRLFGTITVPADKPVVFTSIPYDAGWKVQVDGVPAETMPVLNKTLLAFRAAPGTHELTLTYRPDAVTYGLLFSGIGILLFALLCILSAVRHRKHPDPFPYPEYQEDLGETFCLYTEDGEYLGEIQPEKTAADARKPEQEPSPASEQAEDMPAAPETPENDEPKEHTDD